MTNMIRADFYRILRSRGIYLAITLMLLMIGMSIYGVAAGSVGLHISSGMEDGLENGSSEQTQPLSMSEYRKLQLNAEGHPLDRDVLANNLNLYYVFIFVVVIALTADFSNGTVKNTLSSAIGRNRYFLSKLAIVNLCCTALFILNTYVTHFANILFNSRKFASDIGTITKVSLLQLPAILTLVSVLTGIGFMVKRTAVFNTVTIPFIMVAQLILSFFARFFQLNESFLQYELQTMINKLARDPSGSYLLHSYLVCAAVIVACNSLGYLFFKKTEIS